MDMKVIGHMESDYSEKFGIPRQSGLVDIESRIVFEPEYRAAEALRGIEGFSHLWIIWEFSESVREKWSPTVRPPRMGGNTRMGVFATRSPFRPNPLGLSCVKLLRVESGERGKELVVSGGDLMDGTPIYDIKPYLPYTDSHPEAACGFADNYLKYVIEVKIPDGLAIPQDIDTDVLKAVLSQDPRPAYQSDPDRIYGFKFKEYEIKFSVIDNVLNVVSIEKAT